MKRGRVVGFSLLILLGLAPLGARALDRPLTKDDVTLLLIGGASAQKMIAVIEQRGIDFRMNPDLAKKFHDDGASDDTRGPRSDGLENPRHRRRRGSTWSQADDVGDTDGEAWTETSRGAGSIVTGSRCLRNAVDPMGRCGGDSSAAVLVSTEMFTGQR